jgi:hypothetical protein
MIFKRGDRVIYRPYDDCQRSEYERGIVKRMADDGQHAFVLYHTKSRTFEECDLDNYTAALTAIADLAPLSSEQGSTRPVVKKG